MGSTPECILRDQDVAKNTSLTYVQCTAGNYYFLGLFHNSYEWIKTQAAPDFKARVNIAASFLGNDGKTVVLYDLKNATEFGDTLTTVSDQTSGTAIKQGHILVTCTGYKQSTATQYNPVNTYVNYAFGY